MKAIRGHTDNYILIVDIWLNISFMQRATSSPGVQWSTENLLEILSQFLFDVDRSCKTRDKMF